MIHRPRFWTIAVASGLVFAAPSAAAASFAALISPPYLELKGAPGKTVRESFQIVNTDLAPARYRIRTADWDMDDSGQITFREGNPAGNSCRRWSRIERHEITLGPRVGRPYRFELEVPPGTPSGHCHFAIIIEGLPDEVAQDRRRDDSLSLGFPITGRLAFIVYVTIGDARPALELRGLRIEHVNGRPTPVANFLNKGNAHARPDGVMRASDPKGIELDMVVARNPVLPGQSRDILIVPYDPGPPYKVPDYSLPLKLKGTIEWEGGKVDIDTPLQ